VSALNYIEGMKQTWPYGDMAEASGSFTLPSHLNWLDYGLIKKQQH